MEWGPYGGKMRLYAEREKEASEEPLVRQSQHTELQMIPNCMARVESPSSRRRGYPPPLVWFSYVYALLRYLQDWRKPPRRTTSHALEVYIGSSPCEKESDFSGSSRSSRSRMVRRISRCPTNSKPAKRPSSRARFAVKWQLASRWFIPRRHWGELEFMRWKLDSSVSRVLGVENTQETLSMLCGVLLGSASITSVGSESLWLFGEVESNSSRGKAPSRKVQQPPGVVLGTQIWNQNDKPKWA